MPAFDDAAQYARQWAQVYAHVQRLRAAHQILVVRYEDACASPLQVHRQLLDFCGLEDPAGRVAAAAATLSAPEQAHIEPKVARAVWSEVAEVAGHYGYAPQ